MNNLLQTKELCASEIRSELDAKGYAVASVGNRENYIALCAELGEVGQTRDIFVKPKEMVEKYTGYSHLPEEVPFHTDHPSVNAVGLFCERPDEIGGENLLLDTRDVLEELSPVEIQALREARVPLPRSDEDLPILEDGGEHRPHFYWLPAFALAGMDRWNDACAAAVRKFDQVVSDRRIKKQYLSFKLKAGEAIWFDNFVMLHGRDRLEPESRRLQVRAFIQYRLDARN